MKKAKAKAAFNKKNVIIGIIIINFTLHYTII